MGGDQGQARGDDATHLSELAAEQKRVDVAHDRAGAEIADLEGRLGGSAPAMRRDEVRAIVGTWRERLDELRRDDQPLCFGRIDLDEGDTFYIGRCHLTFGEDIEHTLVNWRSPVAAAYYQATFADPHGLRRRRRFDLDSDQRTLLDLADDTFGDPLPPTDGAVGDAVDAADTGGAGEGPGPLADDAPWAAADLLLSELARDRTGRMSTIVTTIVAEQDRIIRAPAEGLLVIDGGPGTGKTVVGLHRLSRLLYEDAARLEPADVLVIGPSSTFIGYIRQVLPALGDRDVRHRTLGELALGGLTRRARDQVRIGRTDAPEARRLKGDIRLAEVIRRAVDRRVRVPVDGLSTRFRSRELRVPPEAVRDEIRRLRQRGEPLAACRRHLIDGRRRLGTGWVEERMWESFSASLGRFERAFLTEDDRRALADAIRGDRALATQVDHAVNLTDPQMLIRELLTDAELLTSLAGDLLDEWERQVLVRPRERGRRWSWSAADLPMIDEAATELSGVATTYRHVVVDEAQDLTALEARMIARRCPTGGITAMGDPAQATGDGLAASGDWSGLAGHLVGERPWRVERLTTSYRVPVEVVETAELLRQRISPDAPPIEAVRHGGRVDITSSSDLARDLAELLTTLVSDGGLVGVIAPDEALPAARVAMERADLLGVEAPAPIDDAAVCLVPVNLAQGLEFDHVVVLEPAAVLAAGPHGHRLLYVAVTRATRTLTVLHSAGLPVELGGDVEIASGSPLVGNREPTTDELRLELDRLVVERDDLRLHNQQLLDHIAHLTEVVSSARRWLEQVPPDTPSPTPRTDARTTSEPPPGGTGDTWSADEDAVLRRHVDAGAPLAMIVQNTGRPLDDVRRRLAELDLGDATGRDLPDDSPN
ncbi:MAG: AAA family ATPase [Actinomycetota bacterium]|nr:AAA family ATPase [Actinomycetota bacterium]